MTRVMVGARPSNPGMGAMLASMSPSDANNVSKNSALMKMLESFTGPQNQGAKVQFAKMAELTEKFFHAKNVIQHYGDRVGAKPQEMKELYMGMIENITSGGKNDALFASTGNQGFDPYAVQFLDPGRADAGYGQGVFAGQAELLEKMRVAEYIKSNAINPSPQFAAEMQVGATLPIAKEIIPNTVFLRAFPTDVMGPGEVQKQYTTKIRYKAFQQGLTSQVAHNYPEEVVSYDPLLVTPREFERPTVVDMKYIENMQFDVAADILSDAGRELAVLIDQLAFQGLDAIIPNDPTYSGGPPVQGSDTAGFAVDSLTETVMTLEAGVTPTIEHLLVAQMILRQRGYTPDLLITSPYQLGQMMSQQTLLLAYANPESSAQIHGSGLIGSILGNQVAWTPNTFVNGALSQYVIWLVDSKELARIVLKMPITVYPNMNRRKIEYLVMTALALFFRNANAAVKIVCNNNQLGIT